MNETEAIEILEDVQGQLQTEGHMVPKSGSENGERDNRAERSSRSRGGE